MNYLQALLLFCCSIFVVFFDLFRDADILFVRSETVKNRRRESNGGEANESKFFAYFREKIHIKIYRMIIYHFIYAIYLSLLVLMVQKPFGDDHLNGNYWSHWSAALAGFFAINFLVDDIISLVETGPRYFFKSFWFPYKLAKNLIMTVGLVVGALCKNENRADLSGNQPLNIAGSFVAIGLGLEIFVLLRIVVRLEYLGPVCLCLTSVFKDVLRIMPVYTLIFAAHAITALALFVPFQERSDSNHNYTLIEDNLSSKKNLLSSMWWRIIFSEEASSSHIRQKDAADEDFSFEFFHFTCMTVWAVYQIMVAILMLNILIAIMWVIFHVPRACYRFLCLKSNVGIRHMLKFRQALTGSGDTAKLTMR